MNTIHLPGYVVNEYRLVLNPHNELQKKIAEVRRNFNEAFSINKIHSLKANIALAGFKQYELFEERIKQNLKTVTLAYPPFMVQLKDFGSYPTHMIFINVGTKVPVQELTRKIRSSAGRMMKMDDENKPHFFTDPVVHIASKLLPWQYEKAWLQYSNEHFTGRFIADALLLLKRKPGESAWQIVERFEFQNLPVNIKQGELFN